MTFQTNKEEADSYRIEYNPLLSYGLRYHWDVEIYDRSVCDKIDSRGFGIPIPSLEKKNCDAYAKRIRLSLSTELIQKGLADRHNVKYLLNKAIDDAMPAFYSQWDSKKKK